MGAVSDSIRSKLQLAFDPVRLEVVDASERHRGHGGWREGGETHFDVTVVSAAFAGMGRLQRQRAVNLVLAEELAGPVHALSVKAEAPGGS